jgi:methionine sulfoxide reductase heme-binding subunit
VAIKLFIWVLLLSPLAWNVWLGFGDQLGPDPGKALVDSFGLWALRLLLVTLTLRPLRELTGLAVFIRLRRLVGLFAWFYASLHFAAAIFYVVGWSPPELLRAFSEKTYIILGMAAWLLMVPLGVTSNRRAQRRLGKSWLKLHRAIYPLAILACLHFIWLVRSDYWEPAVYLFTLLLLLMWRSPLKNRLRNERPA